MPLERVSGGWRLRLRYGAGLRGRFLLIAKSQVAAEAKAARLVAMAEALAKANHPAARVILEEAAGATTERGLAVTEQVVRDIAASAPSTPTRGPRTFQDVAELWLTGELHRRFPEDVKPKGEHSVKQSRGLLAALFPALGAKPIASITLDDAIAAKEAIPASVSQAQRGHYARHIRTVMGLAEYPLRLIERSPIPKKFVPRYGHKRALGFLYPDEDARLLACATVPRQDRLMYGFLTRNGLRISEALGLIWGDLDLDRGVLTLDKNKTRSPRAWVMTPDVVRAMADYRGDAEDGETVFEVPDLDHVARGFRAHLLEAKVTRRELHASTSERRPIRVHDLRGTFVTLALANGATEAWVMDRTGHTTSGMLNKYRRQARHASELSLGWLHDLDVALGITKKRVGQRVGQRGKIAGTMAENRTWPWSPSTDSSPLPEPKTALPSSRTEPNMDGGPAGLSGVGQSKTNGAAASVPGAARGTPEAVEPAAAPADLSKTNGAAAGVSVPAGHAASAAAPADLITSLRAAAKAAVDEGDWGAVQALGALIDKHTREAATLAPVASLDAARAKRGDR